MKPKHTVYLTGFTWDSRVLKMECKSKWGWGIRFGVEDAELLSPCCQASFSALARKGFLVCADCGGATAFTRSVRVSAQLGDFQEFFLAALTCSVAPLEAVVLASELTEEFQRAREFYFDHD